MSKKCPKVFINTPLFAHFFGDKDLIIVEMHVRKKQSFILHFSPQVHAEQ